MMENRIPSLKCDSDVFVTFEGDNVVMLQVKDRHVCRAQEQCLRSTTVTLCCVLKPHFILLLIILLKFQGF